MRIIISDETQEHSESIKAAISRGYGSDISADIEIIAGWGEALVAVQNDPQVIALIRSTIGVANYVGAAQLLYPRVMTFFPMGSNNFTDVSLFETEEPPVIVTSGAGDSENQNNTGFGKGLEFWDNDLADQFPDDQSSFSNGIILGKLLKIKDMLNCTWWEARFRARMTASRTEPNRETYLWDIHNGYGKIDIAAAIAYKGIIPADPYMSTVVPVVKKILGLEASMPTNYGNGNYTVVDAAAADKALRITTSIYMDQASFTAGKKALAQGTYTLVLTNEIRNIIFNELLKTEDYKNAVVIEE